MANPLLDKRATVKVKKTAQEHCDYGNAHLAEIGRDDVHWVVRNGKPNIEWKCAPIGN